MANDPAPQRAMSFLLPAHLYRHLESQARRFGVSRAGYVRMLVARDRDAETTAKQQAGEV